MNLFAVLSTESDAELASYLPYGTPCPVLVSACNLVGCLPLLVTMSYHIYYVFFVLARRQEMLCCLFFAGRGTRQAFLWCTGMRSRYTVCCVLDECSGKLQQSCMNSMLIVYNLFLFGLSLMTVFPHFVLWTLRTVRKLLPKLWCRYRVVQCFGLFFKYTFMNWYIMYEHQSFIDV